MRTRAANLEDLQHVLRNVFGWDENSDVERAIIAEGRKSVPDLVSMSQEDLDELEVSVVGEDNTTTTRVLTRFERGLIESLQSFIIHRERIGNPMRIAHWRGLQSEEFDDYRASAGYITVRTNARLPPNNLSNSSTRDPVSDFKRGIKRDMSSYPLLKDEKQWDAWNRSVTAIARTHDVIEVFESGCSPANEDERRLFLEKQKFVCAIFDENVLADKGKSIIRKHETTFDAQTAHKELVHHHEKSTSADIQSGDLLTCITSTRIGDGKWRGSLHGFILHWQKQVRLCESLVEKKDRFQDTLKRTMLQNAVQPFPELRAVKTQADQFRAQNGDELTYDQCCSLLTSAAQAADKQRKLSSANPRRTVYEHEVFPDDDEFVDAESYDAADYNIDSSVDMLEINCCGPCPRRFLCLLVRACVKNHMIFYWEKI